MNKKIFMYAFNPKLKRRMLYLREGNSHVLKCMVGSHTFIYDFKAKALEDINALENTINICKKEIEKIKKKELAGVEQK